MRKTKAGRMPKAMDGSRPSQGRDRKQTRHSLGRITYVLLEHDPRLLGVIWEEEDVDPEGMRRRWKIEAGVKLESVTNLTADRRAQPE